MKNKIDKKVKIYLLNKLGKVNGSKLIKEMEDNIKKQLEKNKQ